MGQREAPNGLHSPLITELSPEELTVSTRWHRVQNEAQVQLGGKPGEAWLIRDQESLPLPELGWEMNMMTSLDSDEVWGVPKASEISGLLLEHLLCAGCCSWY